jgi:hypothetical protein
VRQPSVVWMIRFSPSEGGRKRGMSQISSCWVAIYEHGCLS